METGDYVHVWKNEQDSLSGQSLLRPMFAFLLIHCPDEYHPDLLGSIFISSTRQVKFFSKLKVKKEEILKNRLDRVDERTVNTHAEPETNLHEVLSFISSLCLGIEPKKFHLLGKMPCAQNSIPDTYSHVSLSLRLLYNYLFFFDPKRHCAHLFLDPPFLHFSWEKDYYVNRVIREMNYNPTLRNSQNKLDFCGWKSKLTNYPDAIREFENDRKVRQQANPLDSRWKHYLWEQCLRFYANFVKHCHEQVPHTQRLNMMDTTPNKLEELAEDRFAASFFTYRLINEFIYDNPGMEYEQEFLRIKNWVPLGYLQHVDSNGETDGQPVRELPKECC